MKSILVPIDPSQPQRMRAALEQAVRMSREEQAPIRLLRVQPRVSNHVAMFFGPRELLDLQLEQGAEELQAARRLLDVAGVSYTAMVRVGRSAETIIETAREYGCDRIVFGPEEPSLAGKLFGPLSQQVRQLLGTSADDTQVIGS